MNTKPIQLALIVFGLSSCLILAEDDEAKLMQENPDWHITSEVFTNPPYWLVPTNVPFRLGPLSNGKWVWTTNAPTGWFGVDGIDLHMDSDKERQIRDEWNKQLREKRLASLPPGVADVLEYRVTWPASANNNWQGVWREDTNTGWRVILQFYKAIQVGNDTMTILVGSVVTNSGPGLFPTPDGKFAKLELLDATGKKVPTKRGAAFSLYLSQNPIVKDKDITNPHPPSIWDATVERNYPDRISDLEYPRNNIDQGWLKNQTFFKFAGFISNGPPCNIGYIVFKEVFDLKSEGDYALTVQPVLYRQHFDGGTFVGYLDRVDLPSVTTKVHLVPNVK